MQNTISRRKRRDAQKKRLSKKYFLPFRAFNIKRSKTWFAVNIEKSHHVENK